MEEDIKEETRDANIASVLEELEQSLDENQEEMMEEETVEAEEEPMGLMSRRTS
jgi:gas vesicle protein